MPRAPSTKIEEQATLPYTEGVRCKEKERGMGKESETSRLERQEAILKEVSSHIGDALTLLTNLIQEADVMDEHHRSMAHNLLIKLEFLEEQEFLDTEQKAALLRKIKAELGFHLKHVRFTKAKHSAHKLINKRKGKPVEIIPLDII